MLAVAILAAGKGTRMKSTLPKVVHPLGSRSLVEWVLQGIKGLPVDRVLVIVGYQGDRVRETLAGYPNIEFVEQTQQLGTGHAAQQLLPHLEGFEGNLLVLNGDVPLLRPETLEALVKTHQTQAKAATILTACLPEPKGYGRVFCDETYQLQQIIEDRDCTPEQRLNNRVNAGIYCFRWKDLSEALPRLSSDNDQQEYYLTDVITMVESGLAMDVADCQEILGINDRIQLSEAYQVLQNRYKRQLLAAGVTIVDPGSVTIDDTVQVAANAVIEPQTHLRGKTVIGAGSRIGPGSLIEDSQIGDNVSVLYSVVSESSVADNSRIGPFAHLRGHSEVGQGCRIGNFVELKKAKLGDRTNAAHLSYLGDAILGEKVNIGAGTITANYDGVKKHLTTIGDRTKTGANSVLVAPVTLGSDVTVAAGSTVTKDVPDAALVVARAKQTIKEGWTLKPVG